MNRQKVIQVYNMCRGIGRQIGIKIDKQINKQIDRQIEYTNKQVYFNKKKDRKKKLDG